MEQILIACGDVDLLRKVAGDLPDGRFKPIATKSGDGIAKKIDKRNVAVAIVHESLSDMPGAALCNELRALDEPPKILYLAADGAPADGPFDLAIRYPVPGPVLRNAIGRLAPQEAPEQDKDRWRAFYTELKERRDKLAEQNYYAMLGVKVGAPHHVIVKVYDQLSMRYHPDRYTQYRGENWGQKIYELTNELFKELTDAFSVLTDRRLRKKYDTELSKGVLRLDSYVKAGGKDTGPELLENAATTAQGKKFLRLAQRDLARRDWPAALQNLRFAASMEPDSDVINEKIAEVEFNLQES